MDRSLLVKWFGFPATLIHYDTTVLDRWLWLSKRLPITRNNETLIDIGCGTGAFSIGAARKGYKVLGVSWDHANQVAASQRAAFCGVLDARFDVMDIRKLGEHVGLRGSFDCAICLETIEHIIDDLALMAAIAALLKPGGRLLLTTPNYCFRPITPWDAGPFDLAGKGWHVRRGYTKTMLNELGELSGLQMEEISFCSGFLSQKITGLFRRIHTRTPIIAWLLVLSLRIFPPICDRFIHWITDWPYFSICMVAQKPRFGDTRSGRAYGAMRVD